MTLGAAAAPSQDSDFVRVAQYGAVGDGKTDDTAALQAALAAAPSGSTVLCQGGARYLVTAALALSTDDITLDSTARRWCRSRCVPAT